MSDTLFVSETQKPPSRDWVDSYERGLDPWHSDAFKGTPAEGVLGTTEPRRAGWYALDWCGNVIGFIADGTVIDVEAAAFPELAYVGVLIGAA